MLYCFPQTWWIHPQADCKRETTPGLRALSLTMKRDDLINFPLGPVETDRDNKSGLTPQYSKRSLYEEQLTRAVTGIGAMRSPKVVLSDNDDISRESEHWSIRSGTSKEHWSCSQTGEGHKRGTECTNFPLCSLGLGLPFCE
jgi:hypothetical protein